MTYLNEFLTIAFVHLLAVASPGPDFAIVVRNSVAFGRRIAIYTSIGIGLGILVHVAYSLVGLSVIIATTPWLYDTISYCAAAYLVYLAVGALRSKPPKTTPINEVNQTTANNTITTKKALWIGFVTNGINPKATLFFLSLFTVLIDFNTPVGIKAMYGVYLAFATGAWFCFLSYLLSSHKVANFIGEQGYWIDRTMGVLLLGLAAKLVLG